MNPHSDYEPIGEEFIRELSRARGWLSQRLPRILLIALAALV